VYATQKKDMNPHENPKKSAFLLPKFVVGCSLDIEIRKIIT
jgi:hypothetical protein